MRKSLTELFQEFIYECEYVSKLRPRTIANYQQAFGVFMKLLPEISLDQLTRESIITFLKILQERKRIVGKGIIKIGVKNSTVGIYWCRLNAFCKWLELNRHISHNPFLTLKYPKIRFEDSKYLNREDVERILTVIYNLDNGSLFLLKRNLSMLYILLFTGLRKEELLLMQVRDIDLKRRTLTVRAETSKSGKFRVLPLHSKVLLHLKDYLHERRHLTCPYLFLSAKTKEGLTYDGLKHWVERLKRRSGVNFHLHQMRHTFAVNFLRVNNNIHNLKHLLGHSDIRMTHHYLRYLPREELCGNIEKMNLDVFL